jgi:hypothetical protein
MRHPTALAAALCLAGCAGAVDYMPIALPPTDMGPRPVRSVRYFGAPPTEPYVVVGHLDEHGFPPSSLREVLQHLQERAAQIGCDAILTDGSWDHPPPPGAPVPDATPLVSEPSLDPHYRADCLVFQRR